MPKHASSDWGRSSEEDRPDPDATVYYVPDQTAPARETKSVAPVDSPRQMRFETPSYSSSPLVRGAGRAGGRALSYLLKTLAILARLTAVALSLLVVANAFVAGSWRIRVVEITARFTAWLPSAVSGILVFETPFGGVLRGDFVVSAVVLFVVDWLLSRRASSLRRG